MKKRILSVLLIVSIIGSMIFSLSIPITATTYVKDPSSAKGSNYTSSADLAAVLNKVFSGDIDIYSNSGCTKEVSMPIGSRMSNSTQYYVKSKTTGNNVSGWQCYIYANAVYNKLFNEWVGHGTSLSHSKVVISGGSNSVSYDMFNKAGVRCGAYMRTTGNSNGSYSSSVAHSLIILSYNKTSVSYIEGNGDGNGLVRIATKTWSEFNSGHLSGRSRYVCHVIQPTDSYYNSLYNTTVASSITVDKSSISLGTVNNTSTSIKVTCNGEWDTLGWTGSSSVFSISKSSQDGNQISFKVSSKAAGSDTLKFTLYDANDKVVATKNISVSVSAPTLKASASSVSLNLSGTNTSTVTLTPGGDLPSTYYVSANYPSSIVTASLGGWSNGKTTITLTGKAVGSGIVTCNLKNSSNDATVATVNISVSVTGQTYTITYNANGGTGAPASQTKTYGQDLTLSSTKPTGKSYTVTFNGNGGTVFSSSQKYTQTFLGWNTNAEGTGTDFNSGGIYTGNSSTTLYAEWENPTISVSDPTRSGYYFLGWYDSVTVDDYGLPLGKRYTENTKLTESITLYAMWSLSQTVMYGDSDLNGVIEPIDITRFNSYRINGTTDDEILFRGDVDADGDLDFDDITYINNVRIGAIAYTSLPAYQKLYDFYILSYPKTSYEYGEGFDVAGLSAYVYYTTGTYYFFEDNLIVSNYDPYKIGIQTVKVNYYQYSASMTVTVNPPRYSLYYDANGGQISSNGKTVTYGESIGSLPTPTREGYTFLGWSFSQNSSSYVTPSTTYSYTSDKTLYAQWSKNTYILSYDGNGGSPVPSSVTAQYRSSVYISSDRIPERTGYTFLGYSTLSNASNPAYVPGDFIEVTSDVTLYAVWKEVDELVIDEPIEGVINFEGQSVMFGFTPKTDGVYKVNVMSDYDVKLEFPYQIDGMHFTDEGTQVDSFYFSLKAGQTYYAKVRDLDLDNKYAFSIMVEKEIIQHCITLNNEFEAEPIQIQVLENEHYILPVLEKDGYTFLGWKDISTNEYPITELFDVMQDYELIAVWQSSISQGDINEDGVIDAGDAVLISRYDAGFITLTAEQLKAGDVNDDGVVDAGDAVVISRYDAGLIDKI